MTTKYGLIARKSEKWWTAWVTDNPRTDPAVRQPVIGAGGRFSANESVACSEARGVLWQAGPGGRSAAASRLTAAGFTVELFEEPLGPGRPPKAATDKRTRRMVFLATEAEEAAILTRVPPGRDFSDWARERLLGN